MNEEVVMEELRRWVLKQRDTKRIQWASAEGLREGVLEKEIERFDNLLYAVDKQIPQKPVGEIFDYYCPECGYRLGAVAYCPSCGQRIEW